MIAGSGTSKVIIIERCCVRDQFLSHQRGKRGLIFNAITGLPLPYASTPNFQVPTAPNDPGARRYRKEHEAQKEQVFAVGMVRIVGKPDERWVLWSVVMAYIVGIVRRLPLA